jgi:hypothetical protein
MKFLALLLVLVALFATAFAVRTNILCINLFGLKLEKVTLWPLVFIHHLHLELLRVFPPPVQMEENPTMRSDLAAVKKELHGKAYSQLKWKQKVNVVHEKESTATSSTVVMISQDSTSSNGFKATVVSA